jgi:hypothetical protein
MTPDPVEGGNWRGRVPSPVPGSEAHVAIAVDKSLDDIVAIARREGWTSGVYDRGGFFKLAEVWVENNFLIEFLDPEQAAAYRRNMTKANWKRTFGIAA